MRVRRVAVIGAGHGGQAMAAYLGLLGFRVTLYNRSPGPLEPIAAQGGIHLEGEVEGFGPVERVACTIGPELRQCRLVMVVVPATVHRQVARWCAPFLGDGQVVVLHPGRTGGALEFHTALREAGNRADVLVGEAQTLLFASRVTGPARVRIYGFKRQVRAAALPAVRNAELLAVLREVLPLFTAAESVLETSLDNVGAVFHPVPLLLNAGRVEAGQPFEYYRQGITPAVARAVEALDAERLAVAEALGLQLRSARQWLADAYGARGADLYEAVQANPAYQGIGAPGTLAHRYLDEDVPASLVPMAALARRLGVPTPVMDGVIHLAGAVRGTDYWRCGRTLADMGLDGMSAEQIRRWVSLGELDEAMVV
ncbi:NAD/NADP octopine/nopaline dehydrogenase [Thermaerobacter marianensis DSM 12885]|uniref:NAD/NADP octopine/nopaline dehydrogenase n=1 Tax=Thermaerobacter marianensis (strain ATCC 700841 / DSM 12885 / JCM 10246 / 7p75a) TaxID=644966 RepID=E6SJ91_THEM7|nr:NAD/NADP octopine/nopaline dehydrogenase family protein [Thermaerobacter marianensis]ADU51019.1 NAD/NADP octopine/nopaline dehydrogenase [Thermaerobacter marianensis DSM 12885]